MEKQIVSHLCSNTALSLVSGSHKKKIQTALTQEFILISNVAKELGLNLDEVWKIYLAKSAYNKPDTRERRHISTVSEKSYSSCEEKAELAEQEKLKARSAYLALEAQVYDNGYDNGYDIVMHLSFKCAK